MEDEAIKLLHFDTLKPICPCCRQNNSLISPLTIHSVAKQTDDCIYEGVLICSNSQCLREYPIIDGLPILVSDIRRYISDNILQIMCRKDLADTTESIIGDCCGPDSLLGNLRQHLSTYCSNHYDDESETSDSNAPLPGSISALVQQAVGMLKNNVDGPIIDIGCACGRSSFDLAEKYNKVTLGIDLNFSLIQKAAEMLGNGSITFPRRHTGIVYDRHDLAHQCSSAEKVDFWICDATNLPFADEQFCLAASMNLLDCMHSPYNHLTELARIVKTGAEAFLCSPYDWSTNATPVESWLGGHSQRSVNHGSSEKMLHSLLGGGDHPNAIKDLVLQSETSEAPWTLRLHDRSVMHYLAHIISVRKKSL